MAMSESRGRQKWSSDPNGAAWAKDTGKFGFKMLEKYGWSQGAGLGVNLEGRTEHVKIRKKNNNAGIGGTNKDVDYNWLQTQDAFNSVLKNLNAACGTSDGTMSTAPPPDVEIAAESKSAVRASRRAMFQSRFKKSKDVGAMGGNDLKCILGDNSKRPERFSKKEIEVAPGKESMQDYFKRRMAKKAVPTSDDGGAAAKTAGDSADPESGSDAEKEKEVKAEKSKKSKKKKKHEGKNEKEVKAKKSKKKKRARDSDNDDDDDEEEVAEKSRSKKKKKSKKAEKVKAEEKNKDQMGESKEGEKKKKTKKKSKKK